MWGFWHATTIGAFWWTVPLMGLLMCLAFAVLVCRFMTAGRCVMCMGGHEPEGEDLAELRREMTRLREDIDQLGTSR
jgi:hypothetical protein